MQVKGFLKKREKKKVCHTYSGDGVERFRSEAISSTSQGQLSYVKENEFKNEWLFLSQEWLVNLKRKMQVAKSLNQITKSNPILAKKSHPVIIRHNHM